MPNEIRPCGLAQARRQRACPSIHKESGPARNSTCGRQAQDLSCKRFILLHLLDKRGGGFEFRLGPDPVNEENFDRLAGKIAGKIEQKGFEKRLAIVECGPAAVTCRAVEGFCPNHHPDGP